MGKKLLSPEIILPTRVAMHIPADSPIKLSILQFPFAKALSTFMQSFKSIYERQHDELLPFELRPPKRQLNDAILALAPSLVQAFEFTTSDNDFGYVVAFTTPDDDGNPIDTPTLGQLRSLIRHWLELWGQIDAVKNIIEGEGITSWKNLMTALKGDPETQWQHGLSPGDLMSNPNSQNGLAYIALPALLVALLHDKEMTINSEKGMYHLKWRRANAGGKHGLHLVSNLLPYQDDYFAYRLDFHVETQTGHVDSNQQPLLWIFCQISIQRYITGKVDLKEKRNISVLVGFNRDQFSGGWDYHPTLINLPVNRKNDKWQWESGVERLLNSFSAHQPLEADALLNAPQEHGNFFAGDNDFKGDEYYILYAEGRTFGDDRARKHQVKTGISLRERGQIIDRVLTLLDGWLEVSGELNKDIDNLENTFALRDYDYMVDNRADQTKQQASWRLMLETTLKNSEQAHLHIVVLSRSELFQKHATQQIREALMGVNVGDSPLATTSNLPMPATLYFPFDTGDLPEDYPYKQRNEKTSVQTKRWGELMREGYTKKRDEWREYVSKIDWKPNARRLLLIDSTGEFPIHPDRKIKGAIRDACHREGILTQFVVGSNFRLDGRAKHKDELNPSSQGRLKNGVLDLLIRQQGLLYAPPSEIYKLTIGLDEEVAKQLDVIAFCRVERTTPENIKYTLAVRLRANGEVSVLLPHNLKWLPYDVAAHEVGRLFSDERGKIKNPKRKTPLRMGNDELLNFVHAVLTEHLDRPTIAVIEAEGWRNARVEGEQKQCWTQLRNEDLYKTKDLLRFDVARTYQRKATTLENLLGVVRLRMNNETPQYVTADSWNAEDPMRDIPHLTGYVDTVVTKPLHYFSVAGLPETQKDQRDKKVMEKFRGDLKENPYHDIAYKHAQLIEMVPFFVHPSLNSTAGHRQVCRCIHFLRIAPAFTMGQTVHPYPMYLGEKLIEDQLPIFNADA